MSAEAIVRGIAHGYGASVLKDIEYVDDINAKVNNETLLGHAVQNRRVPIVEALLAKGADPNITNYLGNTPLMSLIDKGETDEDKNAAAFFSQPVRPRAYNNNAIENSNNSNNNNSHASASTTNSVKGRAEKNKRVPSSDFYKLLYMLMPITNLNIANNNEETILMLAVKNHQWDVIKPLVQHMASPEYVTSDKKTIFHELAGAISMPYSDGKTAIAYKKELAEYNAELKNVLSALQMLAQYVPAKVLNIADSAGYTALDWSLAYNNYPLAEHLLYKGAKPTDSTWDMVREAEGYGPLMEIFEHLQEGTDVLPVMQPEKDVKVLFGVELEICLKLNPECANISSQEIPESIFQEKTWPELFAMFAKFILKKSPLGELMRKRYEYMYVSGGKKYGAASKLNLSTFEIEELPSEKEVSYDKPFFTMDASVICGDFDGKNPRDRMAKYLPAIQQTFHIELVSPIMHDIHELHDLLSFLGMGRPECFVANDSAGFHVNVSLMNGRTAKFIPLTSDFFTRTFFPKYRHWEYEVFPQVREEETAYAQCIGGKEAERFPELYHEICNNKYVTIHRKDPRHLVEFRLFGSSANMQNLLNYTQMATNFLRDCYIEWYYFYRPTFEKATHPTRKQAQQALLSAQQALQKSLHATQARLRTRKTQKHRAERNRIQKTLRNLRTWRGKSPSKIRTLLRSAMTKRVSAKGKTKSKSKGKSKSL